MVGWNTIVNLVIRLNNDGTLDTTFGVGGRSTQSIASLYATAVQQDGSILVTGEEWDGGVVYQPIVKRLLSNGDSDATFGENGSVVLGTNNGSGYHLSIQADSTILISGRESQRLCVWRLLTDGTPDPSFGGTVSPGVRSGLWVAPWQANSVAWKHKVLPDGGILVTGNRMGTESDWVVVRLTSNGELDTSFGVDGVTVSESRVIDYGHTLAPDSSGRILVAGSFSENRQFVTRLLANGTIDDSFGEAGTVIVPEIVDGGYCGTNMAVLPDDKIVLMGSTDLAELTDAIVTRLLPNGDVDTTFGVDGYATVSVGDGETWMYAMVLDHYGRILCVGKAFNEGLGSVACMRFHPDGTLDDTFGDTDPSGSNVYVFGTALNAVTNVDTITDFVPGTDKLHLSEAIFPAFTEGGAVAFGPNLFYNTGTGVLSYNATGVGGAGAAVTFAILSNLPTLTVDDFVVIA